MEGFGGKCWKPSNGMLYLFVLSLYAASHLTLVLSEKLWIGTLDQSGVGWIFCFTFYAPVCTCQISNIVVALQVWRFLISFSDVLDLWPFTLDEFIQAFHDYVSLSFVLILRFPCFLVFYCCFFHSIVLALYLIYILL